MIAELNYTLLYPRYLFNRQHCPQHPSGYHDSISYIQYFLDVFNRLLIFELCNYLDFINYSFFLKHLFILLRDHFLELSDVLVALVYRVNDIVHVVLEAESHISYENLLISQDSRRERVLLH